MSEEEKEEVRKYARGHHPNTRKHLFTKGQHVEGRGRPKRSEEEKKLTKLSRYKAKLLFNRIMLMKEDQIKELMADKNRTMLEKTICKVMLEALKKGDTVRMEWLLSRTIGKVKEEVEVKLPRPMIVENLEGSATLLGASDTTIEGEVIEDDNI